MTRMSSLHSVKLSDYSHLSKSFDNYKESRRSYFYSDTWWYKDPSFRHEFGVIHLLTDVCPYWSQVSLTLALAIERYILICKSTSAQSLLTTKKRLMFYGAVALTGFLPPALILSHHILSGIDRASPPNCD